MRLTVERFQEREANNRCLVYMDPQGMVKENLRPGEAVKVITFRGRSVVAWVGEPYPEDAGKETIRMDRLQRLSTKARLNEEVEVERVRLGKIKRLVLVPAVDVLAAHHLVEYLKTELVGRKVPVCRGSIFRLTFPHSQAGTTYTVQELEGDAEAGLVGGETEVQLEYREAFDSRSFQITFEDVGGLEGPVRLVREMVQLPLQFPHLYLQLGVSPPRGIIFYGPPGTGKTYLAKAIANEVQARFYYINGPDIIGTYSGETEANLRKMFAEATHHAPSIIMIDELDALAPKRGQTGSHSDTRAVTQLLSLLDGLNKVEGVVVIGTTNRIESLDNALRRPGRFDKEVFFAPPNETDRREILDIHTREMLLSPEAQDYLPELASLTYGFVGADLMELCREAALEAVRRKGELLRDHKAAFNTGLTSIEVTVARQDLERALSRIRPSALRELMLELPDVTWNDIGGLGEVKNLLKTLTHLALERSQVLLKVGIIPPKGILLYGPPGTGKTLLAKAVAKECKANFIALDGPEVFTKWLGESEEAIRHVFHLARQVAPSVLFFDQLDAIAPQRQASLESRTSQRVVSQLLSELDGLEPLSNVLVLAATNQIELVDPSILRPGRLGNHLLVPLPDASGRREIIELYMKKSPLALGVEWELVANKLVERSEGFSGAQLRGLCEAIKMNSLQRRDFEVDGEWVLAPEDLQVALASLDSKPYPAGIAH